MHLYTVGILTPHHTQRVKKGALPILQLPHSDDVTGRHNQERSPHSLEPSEEFPDSFHMCADVWALYEKEDIGIEGEDAGFEAGV